MATMRVTFIQYYEYEVDVDNDLWENDPDAAMEQAEEDASHQFYIDMCYPVAHTSYDDVEVECISD